ncbi:hypothetical protein OSTOST_15445 [Ostertagia ostertagi]
MSRLSKSEGKIRRADSRVSISDASKRMAGCGDWSPTSSRRLYDSDDDSVERSPKSRMTMSCPPYHQPLRLRCRNRPIPRLDFSRVDEFPEAFSSPATTTDSTVSSLSSTQRTRSRSKVCKHSRMLSIKYEITQGIVLDGMISYIWKIGKEFEKISNTTSSAEESV